MSTTAVIFGGTGFIGRHMAVHLLETGRVDRVIAADLKEIDLTTCTETMKQTFQSASWEFKHCDVRDPISWITDDTVIEIYNFAAVHREPGHDSHEYYETNLPGASNVCAWAEKVGCATITFTSSIAPYGPTENLKNENSIPTPESPYGGSKLAAEKIHETWQAADKTNRRLVVVRPGVVFGPGEGGNVSRLIKAVIGRYFVYMGNQQVRKAGTYVKELCQAMTWIIDHQTKWSESC